MSRNLKISPENKDVKTGDWKRIYTIPFISTNRFCNSHLVGMMKSVVIFQKLLFRIRS
jgi:hypothetical protein